jgi:hypothetical protein
MSRQQDAREALRVQWAEYLSSALAPAITLAQEEESARRVIDAVWPQMDVDAVARIDCEDPAFLLRSSGLPAQFLDTLVTELAARAEPHLAATMPKNPYSRGSKLRQIIQQDMAAEEQSIRAAAEDLFRQRQADCLAAPENVRRRVLILLANRVRDAILALQDNDDESEAKRRLKFLSALVTPGGTRVVRDTMRGRLREGRTAAFPYVIKYLTPGEEPTIRWFAGDTTATLDGFTPELLATFSDAALARTCLDRYLRHEGVLCRYIPPDSPIAEPLREEFERLPDTVVRQASGLVMSREAALAQARREWLRMPDGIACAVGLATFIESLLRQAVTALNLGSPANARGGELAHRLADAGLVGDETADNLRVIFDQRSLSLRDAMAHAAFFADDRERVDHMIGGLSQTLRLIQQDLGTAGRWNDVLAHPRWDDGETIAPEHVATIQEQFQPGLNLVDQLLNDEPRRHTFQVIRALVPDKRLLGWAGFLLWVSGQHDEHTGTADEAHHFAALFGGLLTLEELLRALCEVDHQRILRVVSDAGGPLRCYLAMLDDQPGELLDLTRLRSLFRYGRLEDTAVKCFAAVQALRDKMFHGAWRALPRPWAMSTHLVMKMIFKLCAIV